jgi:hypothetical protein
MRVHEVMGVCAETCYKVFFVCVHLAIVALAGVVLQDTISADAVLCTQLLPELAANLVAALPHLQRDDLSWHGSRACCKNWLMQHSMCAL